MNSDLSVLIVGGYGTFGGRIVELLENEPRLMLSIAGRSLERARAYCKTRDGAKARLVPTVFDRRRRPRRATCLAPAAYPRRRQRAFSELWPGPVSGHRSLYRAGRSLPRSGRWIGLRRRRPSLRSGRARRRNLRAFRRVELSRADGGGGAPALGRHGEGDGDPGRHRPLALCRRRHERDPRDRGLCRPALHAPTRRPVSGRLSLYRAHALHHCAAGARAAAQHAVLAGRRSRSACLGRSCGPRRTASGWAPGRFPNCFIARLPGSPGWCA